MSELLQWTTGDRLRKARVAAGVGVGDMAEFLGVTRSMVSRYETDKGTPRIGYYRLWAIRCGVPMEWLQYGEDTPPPQPKKPTAAAVAAARRERLLRGRDSNSQPSG